MTQNVISLVHLCKRYSVVCGNKKKKKKRKGKEKRKERKKRPVAQKGTRKSKLPNAVCSRIGLIMPCIWQPSIPLLTSVQLCALSNVWSEINGRETIFEVHRIRVERLTEVLVLDHKMVPMSCQHPRKCRRRQDGRGTGNRRPQTCLPRGGKSVLFSRGLFSSACISFKTSPLLTCWRVEERKDTNSLVCTLKCHLTACQTPRQELA